MKFYEVQPAFNNGKKIKSKKFGTFFFKDAHLYYERRELIEPIQGFAISVILSDDWEIVEDIPKVKLQRSTDTYFECPNCGAHREVIVYNEDIINNENIRECFKCGTKVKIVNLGEFNKECSQVEALSEYKTWLQHIIEISDQDILTYAGEMNFVKAGEYEIRRGVFEECLGALNEIGVLK